MQLVALREDERTGLNENTWGTLHRLVRLPSIPAYFSRTRLFLRHSRQDIWKSWKAALAQTPAMSCGAASLTRNHYERRRSPCIHRSRSLHRANHNEPKHSLQLALLRNRTPAGDTNLHAIQHDQLDDTHWIVSSVQVHKWNVGKCPKIRDSWFGSAVIFLLPELFS